jgi:hypothetical protein
MSTTSTGAIQVVLNQPDPDLLVMSDLMFVTCETQRSRDGWIDVATHLFNNTPRHTLLPSAFQRINVDLIGLEIHFVQWMKLGFLHHLPEQVEDDENAIIDIVFSK